MPDTLTSTALVMIISPSIYIFMNAQAESDLKTDTLPPSTVPSKFKVQSALSPHVKKYLSVLSPINSEPIILILLFKF